METPKSQGNGVYWLTRAVTRRSDDNPLAVVLERESPAIEASVHARGEAPPPSKTLRSIELFSGAGGLALGTHHAGFHHVALVEWDRAACATLRANVQARAVPGIDRWCVIEGDARDAIENLHPSQLPDIDLIAGGPPCQPFSIGGRHAGMDDPRNMIPVFAAAVRKFRPAAFIVENVRGLTRPGFSDYLRYVVLQFSFPSIAPEPDESWTSHFRRLEALDRITDFGWTRAGARYHVRAKLLNAADFGVPQIRHRVFIVGFRGDLGRDWRFPEPTHFRELLEYEQQTGAYWSRHRIDHPVGSMRGNRTAMLPLQTNHHRPRPWRTVRDGIATLPPLDATGTNGYFNHRFIPGARSYAGHTGSAWDAPAKTLKAGDHGVPGGENTLRLDDNTVRYFSVRETARLQRFPNSWRFEGPWGEVMRQIGNAVPVKLAHVVARSVAKVLINGTT
ncbi:MAG: DNA (cytosine-5-)-methyltransferase [Chloroflexota bacterium]|nr:MAG: DNA (cytosine-5-)-methyltransferase [Chloroflexota bacterium]